MEVQVKFDCIILNPPYHRSRHLKILAEALKHLKDEKSVCVNLSPVRWLERQASDWKTNDDFHRFQDCVAKHIVSIEKFSAKESNQLFQIDTMALGIQILDIAEHDFWKHWHKKFCDSVVEKVAAWTLANESVESHMKLDSMPEDCCMLTTKVAVGTRDVDLKWKYGWFVHDKDKLYWSKGLNEVTKKTYLETRTETAWGNCKPKAENWNIAFQSKDERDNFLAAFKTKLLIYVHSMLIGDDDMGVPVKLYPFLGSATNPRTGLVGYKGEWTDDDLYKFFNITPEEQKVIEETMRKYK